MLKRLIDIPARRLIDPDAEAEGAAGRDPFSAGDSGHRLSALISSPRIVIGGGIIVAIAMLTVCTVILFGGRQDAMEHAADSSRNTLLVIERDIARNIESYDKVRL